MSRNLLKSAADSFLFSSLFIACCAVLMVYQTHWLLLPGSPEHALSAFVFFSTVCSYNFHWYLTPAGANGSQMERWNHFHKNWHLILCVSGFLGSALFFFFIRNHWIALATAAFFTFLYSAPKIPHRTFHMLKRIAIGKTIFLAFVWMYVTSMMPVFVSNQSWKAVDTVYALNRFFLIYAICIPFDYRDRDEDRKEGIRSMITFFSEQGINRLFWFSILIHILTGCWLFHFGFGIGKLIILLIPCLIMAFIYPIAKKNFSDYLYYFLLDGLMALSGLLMLIGRI